MEPIASPEDPMEPIASPEDPMEPIASPDVSQWSTHLDPNGFRLSFWAPFQTTPKLGTEPQEKRATLIFFLTPGLLGGLVGTQGCSICWA